jgi:hypothetical protein
MGTINIFLIEKFVLITASIAIVFLTLLFFVKLKKNNFNLLKSLKEAIKIVKVVLFFALSGLAESFYSGKINWMYALTFTVSSILYAILDIVKESLEELNSTESSESEDSD